MVAKDIFPFATVTDGCKEANFMGFSHYIYENELTSKNTYLPMILTTQKKANFISYSSKYIPRILNLVKSTLVYIILNTLCLVGGQKYLFAKNSEIHIFTVHSVLEGERGRNSSAQLN